jgi:hypothetical protein
MKEYAKGEVLQQIVEESIPSEYYVYWVQRYDGIGPIKIGMTQNLRNRLPQLQTNNPYKLHYIQLLKCDTYNEAVDLENNFHTALQGSRLEGEWFQQEQVDALSIVLEYIVIHVLKSEGVIDTTPNIIIPFTTS